MRTIPFFVFGLTTACSHYTNPNPQEYYVDSENGSDDNEGTISEPWQSLDAISELEFEPGDSIFIKKGTEYDGCVNLTGDGTESQPITLGVFGEGESPRLTNSDSDLCSGNVIQVRGDYHIIEDLYIHHSQPAEANVASFEDVWERGAVHVGLGHDHVIIQRNEFANTPKAIQSYSEYSLITGNYIHDPNDDEQNGFLSEPYWGPIGIQLGIGNQEVSYNTIENMVVEGGEYGADGGAFEIDDGRYHKDNIHIHHNTTYHNMGFVEISYWDDIAFMSSSNIVIEYNVSRDFQTFALWWAPTEDSRIQNNTIIRDDNDVEGNWNTVFIIDEPPSEIEINQNIVVVDNEQTHAIFSEGFNGGINDVIPTDNCYWNADGGNINLGLPSWGDGEIESNPMFSDYEGQQYSLQSNSPAANWGAVE